MAKKLTFSFPLKTPSDGFMFATDTITSEAIKSNLLLLLTTPIGERWYLPDYGCDLRVVLFSPNDDLTNEEIKNVITASVNKFMPQVTIDNINYNVYENEPNAKYIDIKYTFQSNIFQDTNIISIRFVP